MGRGRFVNEFGWRVLPKVYAWPDCRNSVVVPRESLWVAAISAKGRVTRASPVQTAVRNCTRDEGRSFGFGNQVLIPSHRKLLRLNVVVVSVAEKCRDDDPGRQGRERRAQANRR